MIVTQGGIGAYQLSVQKCLELYGILNTDGLAFGWLLWLAQTLLMLITGIICLILMPLYNSKKI
jgi:lipoprotein signal peptidase